MERGSDLIALYQYEQTSTRFQGCRRIAGFALPAGLVADSIVPTTSGLIANGNGLPSVFKIGVGHLANGSGARDDSFCIFIN